MPRPIGRCSTSWGPSPPSWHSRQAGAYHGSILGVLNHVLQADVTWLKRLAHQLPELSFVPPALPVYKVQSLKEIVWDSLPAFRPVREALDELLRRVARDLPPARYPEVLEYRNIRGEPSARSSGGSCCTCSTTRPITAARSPPSSIRPECRTTTPT